MSDAVTGRVCRDESFWQAELDKLNASGLGITEYCRRNGLANSTFSRKRQILTGVVPVPRKKPGMNPGDQKPAKARRGRPSGSRSAAFIELKPSALFASESLRIILPTGITLEVPDRYKPEQLAQVLALCRAGS